MNLKLRRIKLGLTQKELAEKAGITNVTIVKIEKGDIDTIKFGTLKKLAALLGCTVQELFLEED